MKNKNKNAFCPHRLKLHPHQIALQDSQEAGYERLEMEDDLTPQVDPVFVEGAPLDHVCLERVVELGDQSECQQF